MNIENPYKEVKDTSKNARMIFAINLNKNFEVNILVENFNNLNKKEINSLNFLIYKNFIDLVNVDKENFVVKVVLYLNSTNAFYNKKSIYTIRNSK